MTKKPVILCILDGWGAREGGADNAIAHAHTPCWDQMLTRYPHTQLATSGLAVGLPEGQMGNSEVGHMNIGSGRVVMQNLPRINQALASGELAAHPLITDSIANLKTTGKTCHLLGLLSDGGVHGHIDHIIGLATLYAEHGITVAIHVFTDGRDTAPGTAHAFIQQLEDALKDHPHAQIASLCGRYYAMDRDQRMERMEASYNAIANAKGQQAVSATKAITEATEAGQGDEFIAPYVIGDYAGMANGDVLLMANFRADRARQMLSALCDPQFDGFARTSISFSAQIGMVEYSAAHSEFMQTLFPSKALSGILGEVISAHGLTQLRIAETEKYAHVTFFFNGGKEQEYPGEQRILVPSPQVATYDLQPEMSAPLLTQHLLDAIENKRYDVIVVNYANTDMVGHTGNFKAAIKAVEAVDQSLTQLEQAVLKLGGVMLVTADHGNAEQMVDSHGNPHTQHTTGPVPLVMVGELANTTLTNGKLSDIAPTMLHLLGIDQPKEMTGTVLIKNK
jgi:2,3-bisphosphoglycerate-independent phosphoglycerate mutase